MVRYTTLGLKKPQKALKKAKTLPKLIKEADREFSRYVRLRDCEYKDGVWVGACISCERQLVVVDADLHWNSGSNLGHYVSRAAKSTRYSEENCNLQCAACNAWRDKVSMLDSYRRALNQKYGNGTAQRLKRESKILHKPTRQELEQIIKDSKEYVKFSLAHPSGL